MEVHELHSVHPQETPVVVRGSEQIDPEVNVSEQHLVTLNPDVVRHEGAEGVMEESFRGVPVDPVPTGLP